MSWFKFLLPTFRRCWVERLPLQDSPVGEPLRTHLKASKEKSAARLAVGQRPELSQ